MRNTYLRISPKWYFILAVRGDLMLVMGGTVWCKGEKYALKEFNRLDILVQLGIVEVLYRTKRRSKAFEHYKMLELLEGA